MIKCPGFFSLPKKTKHIVHLKSSTFSASMRLLWKYLIVTRNVDHFKSHIHRVFLGSEEKQGNEVGVVP